MADGKWTFDFTSNVPATISAKDRAVSRALEKMGGKAETYAKKLCPVDTGRLRNSITHTRSTTETATEAVINNIGACPYRLAIPGRT